MSAYDYEPCGLGICAANEGHAGTCAEASGWPEIPTKPPHPPLSATAAESDTATPPERESAAQRQGASHE